MARHFRKTSNKKLSTTNNKKIKLENTTFRLNEEFMKNVQVEAENKMLNMNTMIVQILKSFVEWNQFEPLSGMVHIPKPVLREIFNKKSDKEIIDMTESIGKNAIYNTILFIKGKKDLNAFLSWIETEMNNHSLNIRHIIEGEIHKYIIKHDLGYRFSLYYKTIIESIFKDQLGEKIYLVISDELILFDFKY
jgi:hypothetical protein